MPPAASSTSNSDLRVFALDVDEVLANTMEQCNAWHNDTYGTSLTVEDYESYNFCETWNCSDEEAMHRFRAFTQSSYWDAIQPVEGAQRFVKEMQGRFRLAVVTSRQNFLQESTYKWLHRHFGLDSFSYIMFGNQWLADKEAVKISKFEMCREIDAIALVDDLPKYILQVAPIVTKAILFNFKGRQKWSRLPSSSSMTEYPSICHCTSWSEVYAIALSLCEIPPQVKTVKDESIETLTEVRNEVPV